MAQAKKKAQSPYVKYQKAPYIYTFKGCKHSRKVYQSVPASGNGDGWSGEVCASCNNIVRKFDRDERRDRAA